MKADCTAKLLLPHGIPTRSRTEFISLGPIHTIRCAIGTLELGFSAYRLGIRYLFPFVFSSPKSSKQSQRWYAVQESNPLSRVVEALDVSVTPTAHKPCINTGRTANLPRIAEPDRSPWLASYELNVESALSERVVLPFHHSPILWTYRG